MCLWQMRFFLWMFCLLLLQILYCQKHDLLFISRTDRKIPLMAAFLLPIDPVTFNFAILRRIVFGNYLRYFLAYWSLPLLERSGVWVAVLLLMTYTGKIKCAPLCKQGEPCCPSTLISLHPAGNPQCIQHHREAVHWGKHVHAATTLKKCAA